MLAPLVRLYPWACRGCGLRMLLFSKQKKK